MTPGPAVRVRATRVRGRCHQELVTAGTLVPPASWGAQGQKEKGAVIRWRSIKREVNGLQVRPARCGRRPATRYAQQLIRLLPEVEVQDSIATMVEPVLAASSRGRRGS